MATAESTSRMLSAVPAEHDDEDQTLALLVGGFLLTSCLFIPRLFILGFWIFGSQLGDAFSSWVIPAVGFIVLPWTTITYALLWGMNSDRLYGAEWTFVVIAFLIDLWTWLLLKRMIDAFR
jgi:RsiW-degrading membrane proteinase PrsW (M82 family)